MRRREFFKATLAFLGLSCASEQPTEACSAWSLRSDADYIVLYLLSLPSDERVRAMMKLSKVNPALRDMVDKSITDIANGTLQRMRGVAYREGLRSYL
jgi:hypothetical protein